MAIRDTGPDILPVTGAGIIKGSRLCNFETSQHYLKLSHQAELDQILDVIRKNPGYWVEIEGYASRAGDRGYNKALSERRAQSVRSYLEKGVTRLNVTTFTAFGEDESGGGERNNDGMWRAVTVRIYATKPPPRPAPPKEDKPLQNFAIRIQSMSSLSIPIIKLGQLDLFVFFIVDLDKKLGASYQYTGAAGAPPSPFSISPVSFADKGPWTMFQVLRHDQNFVRVVLEDFADKANLIQAPGAQVAKAGVGGTVQLTFESDKIKKKKCGIVPAGLNISGGTGFQLPSPGSIGFGSLKLNSDVEAFHGTVVPNQIT